MSNSKVKVKLDREERKGTIIKMGKCPVCKCKSCVLHNFKKNVIIECAVCGEMVSLDK